MTPTTSSALPYIGELSISLPPALCMPLITLLRTSDSCSLDTSKACQVPRPITGKDSFVDGMSRSIILVLIFLKNYSCLENCNSNAAIIKPVNKFNRSILPGKLINIGVRSCARRRVVHHVKSPHAFNCQEKLTGGVSCAETLQSSV